MTLPTLLVLVVLWLSAALLVWTLLYAAAESDGTQSPGREQSNSDKQ